VGSTADDLLEGKLGDVPMSALLTLAVDRASTGSLHLVEPDGREHVVRLKDGRSTKVRAPDGYARLGDLLVDGGHVDRHAMEEAAGLGGPLGDMLELTGKTDRVSIERAMHRQVRLRIARLFSLSDDTTFRLVESEDTLAGWGVDVVGLEPLALILAGVRDQELDGPLLRGTLAALGDRGLRLHRLAAPARFDLDVAERAALTLLADRPLTLAEWIALAEPPASTVRRLAFALVLTRHLGTGDERTPVGVIGDLDPNSSQRVARVALRSNPPVGATSEVTVPRNADPRAEPDEEPPPVSVREVTLDCDEMLEVARSMADAGDVDALLDLLQFVEGQSKNYDDLLPLTLWLRSFKQGASGHSLLEDLDRAVERADVGHARLCRALLRRKLGDEPGARTDLEALLARDPENRPAHELLDEWRANSDVSA